MSDMERVRAQRRNEHRKGDVRKACEKCGVTPPVFQSALKKEKIEDLTEKELRVIYAYLEIQNERRKENEYLREFIRDMENP